MNAHTEARNNSRIQVAGLVVVLLSASVLIGVIMWSVLTGRTLSAERAEESARLQFELTRADMCANAAILSIDPRERSAERVQMIVNDCLAQVELPFVIIEVPDE